MAEREPGLRRLGTMERRLRRAGYVERRFKNGEVELNYAVGPKAGPPLVLIPGQTMPWQSYTRVLTALARRFHVHAVDVRGHGKSSRTPGDYSFEAMGRDAVALIEGAIGRPVLVSGNSSGGVIAVWLAANAPEWIAAIALEDPPLLSCEWPRLKECFVYEVMQLAVETLADRGERDIAAFLRGLEIPSRGRTRIANLPAPLVSLIAGYLRFHQRRHSGEAVDLKLLPFPVRLMVRGFSEYDPEFSRAFLDGSAGKGFDHAEALSRIECPVLLMHCNWFLHERFGLVGAMSGDDADRVVSLVRDIRRVPIPGGHVVHQEKPQRFVSEIVRFAEEVGYLG